MTDILDTVKAKLETLDLLNNPDIATPFQYERFRDEVRRQAVDWLRALVAEVERVRQERDLAVAHDRQPYPTAEAYEVVCKALHVREADLTALRQRHALLETQVDYIVSMQDDKTINPGDELIATREEIRALRQRHAEAVEAFRAYADHEDMCAHIEDLTLPCTCGFAEAKARLT